MMGAFVDDTNFADERKLLRDVFSPETRDGAVYWVYHYDAHYYKVLSACAKLRLRTRNLPEGNPTYIEIRDADWRGVFGSAEAQHTSLSAETPEEAAPEADVAEAEAVEAEAVETMAVEEPETAPEEPVFETEPVAEVEFETAPETEDEEPDIEEAVNALAKSQPPLERLDADLEAGEPADEDAGETEDASDLAETVPDLPFADPVSKAVASMEHAPEPLAPVTIPELPPYTPPAPPAFVMPSPPPQRQETPPPAESGEDPADPALEKQRARARDAGQAAFRARESAIQIREDAVLQREETLRAREETLDISDEELRVTEQHLQQKSEQLQRRNQELANLKQRLDEEIERLRAQKSEVIALSTHTGKVGKALLNTLP